MVTSKVLEKKIEPIEPDAMTLAVMLSTSELANYSDEIALNEAIEIFMNGYSSLTETRITPSDAHMAFRWLYCVTDGYFNDIVSEIINQFNPPYELDDIQGVLGELNKNEINYITEQIDNDGFYVFKEKLPIEICDRLREFALTTASLPYNPPFPHNKTFYDRHNLLAPTYHFDELELINNLEIQNLLTDTSILAVAQAYLGCKPIQDLVAMWWSTNFEKKANSAAAQLYHFDMDRIKFIKFFIYLSEVTPENGPHCYVKGSRKSKPPELLRDGRISDVEINQYYRQEDIVEITGLCGTIIAADTRGFHKGKPLISGERLVLQLEFSNSLFGGSYSPVILDNMSMNFINYIDRFRYTYSRFV
ncbi:phytanoyl-CoA dioxygenase family protein [Nostoc sp. TCL26-01]|uniref:phytanoyl-CoA dioxygenase family protein n=1 Tax=Nostoc sp. TCL26-01 TaxID=2576904 RepID=UPI0015BAAF38|nr:phytanoyl-CoA dioxygenase family protein [Nostoc sp. TCL26-01]QLE59131.1 hypothetical protein FD725_28720 [Nostoc sp. TCL26-01]